MGTEEGEPKSQRMQQLAVVFEFLISNFEFRLQADLASVARKDTQRKMGRTSRSCIAR